MDTSLTPTDLFSPSKARQQRAQAQDWAHIESWLSYKYAGRSIPNFERNEETLKALRALATVNERADEERALIARVEREALKELEEVRHSTTVQKREKCDSRGFGFAFWE
jgi:HAUS augmin-like complex subunit 1